MPIGKWIMKGGDVLLALFTVYLFFFILVYFSRIRKAKSMCFWNHSAYFLAIGYPRNYSRTASSLQYRRNDGNHIVCSDEYI